MWVRVIFLLPFVILEKARTQNLTPQPNIVGGETVEATDRPFQVALLTNNTLCGGTIIDENNILTAAHCVDRREPSEYRIVVGTINRTDPYKTYEASKLIPHEDWDRQNIRNDIALIQTTVPMEFDDYVQPATLPEPNSEVSFGTQAVVSGWGREQSLRSPLPQELKEVTVTVIGNSYCGLTTQYITDQKICTTSFFSRRGTCAGDSGGPLTINGNEIIGIVSYGYAVPICVIPFLPSVYTRVSEYIDWIESHK